MSEQPITREQAIKAKELVKNLTTSAYLHAGDTVTVKKDDYLAAVEMLRELEGEKKTPDPDPYGHDLFLGIRSHIENGRLDPRKTGDRDIIMLAIEESWTELRLDRELDQRAEAEKKAVEPVSYERLIAWGENCVSQEPIIMAAVLRVVEEQVQPFLQTRWLSRQSNDLASEILAALAQARRPS